MQFMILGYDGTDDKALERRLAVRENHLASAARMREEGILLYAAAILSDEGKMAGSMMVCDFPSREELNKWLDVEPYVKGRVWEKIEIRPCQVAPFCAK